MSIISYRPSINDLERNKFNNDGSVHISPGENSRDAFGKLRISTPHGVFDSKQIGDNDPGAWDTIIVGAGSSASYVQDSSSTTITVDSNAGDRATRQTRFYWPYLPGRSHAISMTGTLGEPVEGVYKRIGYFDDDNGLFFELAGDGTVNVVVRSSTSGSPVETRIPQSEWNLDTLDGVSNHSIARLDLTKSQIFLIDFQWLGVGDVRFGISINGHPHYVHVIHHANNTAGVYMKTPTLPIRYEVYNEDGGNTAEIEQICSTVVSEGGYDNAGFEFSVSNGAVTRAISTRTPILAIRMAATFNGDVNRRTARLLAQSLYASSASCYWEVMHYHDPASVTGNFISAGASSSVEYSVDISAITAGGPAHRIDTGFVSAGSGTNQAGAENLTTHSTRHTVLSRNAANDNSHYMIIFATPFSGTADVSAAMNWVEMS